MLRNLFINTQLQNFYTRITSLPLHSLIHSLQLPKSALKKTNLRSSLQKYVSQIFKIYRFLLIKQLHKKLLHALFFFNASRILSLFPSFLNHVSQFPNRLQQFPKLLSRKNICVLLYNSRALCKKCFVAT